MLFHVFFWKNSCWDISFYLVEVQPLNQMKKLENAHFHEDLMLFSLYNDCGTLITAVVRYKRAITQFHEEGHDQITKCQGLSV